MTQKFPVPGPESNDLSGAAMDTVADGSSTVRVSRPKRIQWTKSLDASILVLNDLAGPPHAQGRVDRLQALWEKAHPNLPSRVNALTQRLSRLRKANITAQDLSQFLVATPSAEEHSPTVPSVLGEGPRVNNMGQPATQAEEDEPQSSGPIPSTLAQGQPALVRYDEDDHVDGVPSTPSDELREEYQAVLREVLLEGVGCFDKRKRLLCQGVRIDRNLVKQVDELIDEEWFYSLEQTLWRLNCIVYAGAVVVERGSRKSPVQQRVQELEVALKAKQAEVTQLRRKVGWLTNEIARRKVNSRPTERQYSNINRLRRMFGPQTLRQMEVQVEGLKGYSCWSTHDIVSSSPPFINFVPISTGV